MEILAVPGYALGMGFAAVLPIGMFVAVKNDK